MSICVPKQAKLHRWLVWLIVKLLAKKLKLKKYVISGSYRRGKTWINDIDLLVPINSDSEGEGIKMLLIKAGWKRPYNTNNVPKDLVFREQFVKRLNGKYVVLDLFLCPPGSWGNALLFTTGSKKFNDIIRSGLGERGYTWENPRYFTHLKSRTKISFESEEQALSFLGIKAVSPKRRF